MKEATLTELVRHLPDFAGPDWWRATRQRAAEAYLAAGLPDRKVEEWKYSSLAGLAQQAYAIQPGELQPEWLHRLQPDAICLVWVDGVLDLKHSQLEDLPEGLSIQPLQQGVESDDPHVRELLEQVPQGRDKALVNLNTALTQQGVLIRLDAGAQPGRPVEMHYFCTPGRSTAQVRNLVLLHHHAELDWLEIHHVAAGAEGLANVYNQVWMDDHSRLNQIRLQESAAEQTGQHLITRTEISQGEDSHHALFSLDLGGCMVRHDAHNRLRGPQATSRMYGSWITRGASHVDNHLRVDHESPNCTSSQLYRGVMDGRSRGVFNGKVIVHPGADGTEAHQNNANLLLSRQAEVDTKPELEIYADEVVCSHGATVGQLDDNALFYLQARGIPRDEARRMLMLAFCQEALEPVPLAAVRQQMEQWVRQHLGAE